VFHSKSKFGVKHNCEINPLALAVLMLIAYFQKNIQAATNEKIEEENY
jgi:hypothetical protein